MVRMFRRHIIDSDICSTCGMPGEDLAHVFFDCVLSSSNLSALYLANHVVDHVFSSSDSAGGGCC